MAGHPHPAYPAPGTTGSGLLAEAGRYLFVAAPTDLAEGHDSTAPARREGSRRNWTKPPALYATGRPRTPRQGPWRPRPSSRPPVPTSTSVPSTDGNARSVFLTPVLTLAGARTTTWRGSEGDTMRPGTSTTL